MWTRTPWRPTQDAVETDVFEMQHLICLFAYIQVDFQLTRGDDLKKLGKMIGYTTADVSNKHNAKTVLMEDYLSFLRSNHPDQILEPGAIDHTVR